MLFEKSWSIYYSNEIAWAEIQPRRWAGRVVDLKLSIMFLSRLRVVLARE
jgi:hypothetical protein